MSLKGKVIVITGASAGIGATLAKQVNEKGAKVVISARRVEELEKVAASCKTPSEVFVQRADVTKREDHESLLRETIRRFGKVDVWVNNAGVGIVKSALATTDEEFDLMMTINAKSALYGMQTILPYYKEQRQGQVINVSSFLGRMPTASFRAAYSASKAAVNSLTCNIRVDLQNEGFRDIYVALFSPGVTQTEFGVNSVGEGNKPDSRLLPGSQPVEEVAEVLAKMIENPAESVDVYSRPAYRPLIAGYYSAEDVRSIESLPPFAPARPSSASRK